MARIAGINIPPHQHAEIGLTAIYGIGRARARAILEAAAVPFDKKVKELNDAEVERIREEIARVTVEGDLRREIAAVDQAIDRPRHVPRRAASPRVCRCAASARVPMPARARARARPACR